MCLCKKKYTVRVHLWNNETKKREICESLSIIEHQDKKGEECFPRPSKALENIDNPFPFIR